MKPICILFALLALCSPLWAQQSPHSIGLGAHYWQVLDDYEDLDFDESGIAWLAAYRYDSGLIAFQVEVEVFPEDFGASGETVLSPQGLVILGDGLYAGLGAGILYSDGDFAESPFFMLRAGFNIVALGPVTLDLNANYVFTDFGEITSGDLDIDTDTITLGAMARINF